MRQVLAVCGIAALAAAAGGCACGSSGKCWGADRDHRTSNAPAAPTYYAENSFVGPRGPDGPTGATGERGMTGQQGVPGYATAGPRGDAGAMGYAGEQGRTGAAGPSGAVVRGQVGVQGPAGDEGERGASGYAGARGESALGYAGPAGVRGPTGPAGPTGPTGARGATLEGPTGPAGRSGSAGAQGTTGYVGAQGSTTLGVAGPTGPSGATGPQGPRGEMGAQGRVGVVDRWTSYRDLWFDFGSAEIRDSEETKLNEIATYLKRNPSLQIAIDGTMDPRGTDPRDQNLCDRRVNSVRNALIDAGVPGHRIVLGAVGNPELRRDRRVEVLIATRD